MSIGKESGDTLNFDHYANVRPSDEYLSTFITNISSGYNPNSSHVLGNRAKNMLAESVNVLNNLFPMYRNVEFISGGGTYANEFVFFSTLPNRAICGENDVVVISNIEHSSILKMIAGKLTDRGFVIVKIPVLSEGTINLASLRETLIEFGDRVKLVSIMNINNETGIRQPIDEIYEIIKEVTPKAIFHSDACQGINRLKHLKNIPDVVTSSLYKIGGGHVGLVLHNLKISQKYGTPDVLNIYASVMALKSHIDNHDDEVSKTSKIKKYIIEQLKIKLMDVKLTDVKNYFLIEDHQESNIIGFILPFIKSSYIQSELSKSGICIGSGSACNKNSPSNTLLSMGYSASASEGFMRISFDSKVGSEEDLNRFITKLLDIINQMCKIKISHGTNDIYIAPHPKKVIYPSIRKERADEYVKMDILSVPECNGVMVTFGELVLKGLNKEQFIKRLQTNIRNCLKMFDIKIVIMRGYAIITTDVDNIDKIVDISTKIPGIATVHPLYMCKFTDEGSKLANYVSSLYDHLNKSNLPFCIRTKIHNGKTYDGKTARDLEYSLGRHLKDRFGGTVKLSSPPFQINIIIEKNFIMCYTQSLKGGGGLPEGTEGEIGIIINRSNVNRSMVAIFEMCKRGAMPLILIDMNLPSEFRDVVVNTVGSITPNFRIEEIEFNNVNIKIGTPIKNIILESNTRQIKKYFRFLKELGKKIDKHVFTSTVSYDSETVQNIMKDNNIRINTDDDDQCINIMENNIVIELDPHIIRPKIKGLSLLSGGIDSPVASSIAIGIGIDVDFIHFSSNETDLNNIIKMAKRIVLNSGIDIQKVETLLYFVDISKLQRYIVENFKEEYRTMLYKTYMIKIANDIKYKYYDTLIMGSSWGQVASQTPENLCITDKISNLPIFNPLITKNKDDIIKLAKKCDTYECSICNGEDCCTLFTPKHPVLKSSIGYIMDVVTKIPDYKKMIDTQIISVNNGKIMEK